MSLPAAFLRDAERLIPAERRFDDPIHEQRLQLVDVVFREVPFDQERPG